MRGQLNFAALLFFVATFMLARPGRAQDQVVLAQNWTIHSQVLGEDRAISVHLPEGYDKSSDRYPVLYVLDGEQLLIPISGVTEILSWGYRGPDIIVVAIRNVHRSKDFTVPLDAPGAETNYRSVGGADKFLQFLQSELIPQVESKYRVARYRIIFGHSLAGLMALHAFVAAPGLFDATIASSPPADYNGDYIVNRINTLFAEGKGNKGSLYLCMAAREYDDSPRAIRKLQELLRLRAPQGLHWDSRVIPDTDHGTSLLFAAQQGLEFAFSDWRLPALVFDEGLDSIEHFYRQQSELYGMNLLPPEPELDALGQRLLRAKNSVEAIRVYQRYASLYPDTIEPHHQLSKALKSTGKLDEARQELQLAIQLAHKSNDPSEADLQKELDGLGPK